MDAMENSALMNKIREELSNLAKFVDKTRKGIDTLESTVKMGTEKFPEASYQLKTVTGDLENAANNIMTLLETMMTEQERTHELLGALTKWAGGLKPEDGEGGKPLIAELTAIHNKSKAEIMEIFGNMSFQDLTGQKLKKVIGGLSTIESKILELAVNFGFAEGVSADEKTEILTQLKSASVETPINQDVVDKILRELGA